MKLSPHLLVSLVAVGCLEQTDQAELLLPDPISVEGHDAYEGEGDGLGALVPVDLMAYDGATGQPLESIPLAVWATSGSAWPVEADEVVVVDPDDCYGCELLWDAQRDEFLLAPQVSDSLNLSTDADGLARLYVYVDAFSDSDGAGGVGGSAGGELEDIVVLVVMGEDEQSFLLLPR